eukprot:UN22194
MLVHFGNMEIAAPRESTEQIVTKEMGRVAYRGIAFAVNAVPSKLMEPRVLPMQIATVVGAKKVDGNLDAPALVKLKHSNVTNIHKKILDGFTVDIAVRRSSVKVIKALSLRWEIMEITAVGIVGAVHLEFITEKRCVRI